MTKTINLLAPSLDIEKGFSIGWCKEGNTVTLIFKDYRFTNLISEFMRRDLFSIKYTIPNVHYAAEELAKSNPWIATDSDSLHYYRSSIIKGITDESLIIHMTSESNVYGYKLSYIGRLTFNGTHFLYERLAMSSVTKSPHKITEVYSIAGVEVNEEQYNKFKYSTHNPVIKSLVITKQFVGNH